MLVFRIPYFANSETTQCSFFIPVQFPIISYCSILFTIDLCIKSIVDFDYQIATNNTVNQCRLFFHKHYRDFLSLKTFGDCYYFASSSALKVIHVKFVRLSNMMQNECESSDSSENRNHILG